MHCLSCLSITKPLAFASLPQNDSPPIQTTHTTKLPMRRPTPSTLPRTQHRKRQQPSIAEIERAIGDGRYRDIDARELKEEQEAEFNFISLSFRGKFVGQVEKKLRETGEWLATWTETEFRALTHACMKYQKLFNEFSLNKASLAIQVGSLIAAVEQPALAVTGVNNEEDLTSTLIQLGIVAFGYLIIAPPIILNWLRIRWYRRNLLEMYFQFMFVFIFFPGVLLWAPFLNFRKFPRDPSMKYPWSTPQDPSKIKNDYLKYPYAEPEDYV